MPDDLRQLIDELRTAAKEHFANPTESHYSPRSTRYRKAACAVAFRLADAYDAATAETQRVAGLYRELAAAICGPTMQCEDHRILLLEAAKHRGEWQSLCVVAKDATIAERDAEISRLRAALEPFAEHSRTRRASTVTDGDLQRAADALKGANRDE